MEINGIPVERIGECKKGTQKIWCENDETKVGKCEGAVYPQPEVDGDPLESCNGKDEDCNGINDGFSQSRIDECPPEQRQYRYCIDGTWSSWSECAQRACKEGERDFPECDTGLSDECAPGYMVGTCRDGHFQYRENGTCYPLNAEPEICADGKDNDCNGIVDDPEICEPVCVPTEEICDNLDNDCDQDIDEEIYQVTYSGPTDTSGAGICQPEIEQCINGTFITIQEEVNPEIEVCDNLDNDCDRLTDEDLTQITYSGPPGTQDVGICKPKIQECINGAYVVTQQEVTPLTESCNNLDDNCDGQTDEGCQPPPICEEGEIKTSYSGQPGTAGVGICKEKIEQCTNETFVTIQEEVLPKNETCNNLDDNCNGVTDEALFISSYSGPLETQDVGICQSEIKQCINGTYIITQQQVLPQAESCNNLDDNCNGQTDENLTQITYSGPPGTQDVGICKPKIQECINGSYTTTQQQVLPQPESCNNLNDDCDGETDEGLGFTTCGLGICEHTINNCENGVPQTCNPLQGASAEICDNLDNDCDGQTDENLGFTTCGLGVCNHTVNNCENGIPQVCDPLEGASEEIACNNVDENCDGLDYSGPLAPGDKCLIDLFNCSESEKSQYWQGMDCLEGEIICSYYLNKSGLMCLTTVGGSQGWPVINESSWWCGSVISYDANLIGVDNDGDDYKTGLCGPRDCDDNNPAINPAATEICNNLDDNCDGQKDEGLGQTTCGLGACQHTVNNCENGVPQTCNPLQGASTEICDNLDNDCDGEIDEGLGFTTCGLGICEHTINNCENGVPQTCNPLQGASTEVCDNLDNDCDGQTDEGLTQTKYSGPQGTAGVGICKEEIIVCEGGILKKSQEEVLPQDEVPCNNIDEDCNGTAFQGTDNDSDGYKLEGGLCGPVDCDDTNPTINPSAAEICNNLDDNCDNHTDEDLTQITYSGPPGTENVGICKPKIKECINGSYVTTQTEVLPQTETCNNLNDDCDGQTDENLGFTTCGLGVCEHTINNCENGIPQTCNPLQGASTEICDNLDNDCDGQTDEGLTQTKYSGPQGTAGVGICKEEIKVCENGIYVVKQEEVLPQSEIPCNDVDEDCNGIAFQGTDNDSDGYKLEGGLCGPVDCDDANPKVYPNAPELYDCIDNNCDGKVDNEISLGTADAAWVGESEWGGLGLWFSSGNINKDEFNDILITSQTGKTYLIYGSSVKFSGATSIADTSEASFAHENASSAFFSHAADLNSNGFDDIFIGDFGNSEYQYSGGKVYIFYGSNIISGNYNLNSANLTLLGKGYDKSGYIIQSGDINGDGYHDILIGNTGTEVAGNHGKVSLIYGPKNLEGIFELDNVADVEFVPPQSMYFNNGVTISTGNINNDLFGDIAIGSRSLTYIIYGANNLPANFDLSLAPAYFIDKDDYFSTIKIVGDVNGDGFDDLFGATYSAGEAFGVLGSNNIFGENDLAQSPIKIIGNSNMLQSYFWPGDINKDGYKDLILTARDLGKTYIFTGSDNLSGTKPLNEADFSFVEENQGDIAYGQNATFINDINGDGFNEIIIGACAYKTNDTTTGKVYLFYGKACDQQPPVDNDGDGFIGTPVGAGPDCDDNNPAINPDASEICNNLDDNCDGQKDEGFNVGEPCRVGVGGCVNYGNYVCGPNGLVTICNVEPLPPVEEICDNIDNDCDGIIDNAPVCTCDPDGDGIITDKFTDPAFLNAVREALGKGPTDDITMEDAIYTTSLSAIEKNINDISGIECFVNLIGFAAHSNYISNLSPLAKLTKLTGLALSWNQISDLSPLAGLINLTVLQLTANFSINDIIALINNPGLGEGDKVYLQGNTQIPAVQIDALKDKGVTVYWP